MKRALHLLSLFISAALTLSVLPSCHSSKKAKGDYQQQIDQLGNLGKMENKTGDKASKKEEKLSRKPIHGSALPTLMRMLRRGKAPIAPAWCSVSTKRSPG